MARAGMGPHDGAEGFALRAAMSSSSGLLWSPPVGARAASDSQRFASLRVSEILYKPRPPTPSEAAAGATDHSFEFVELLNAGTAVADLSGLTFTSGIECSIPEGVALAPGANLFVWCGVLPNPAGHCREVGAYAARLLS